METPYQVKSPHPRKPRSSDEDFTLHRSTLTEKSFPALSSLERELSGMEHIKIEYHIKGNLVIAYIESSWAGSKIFGNNSGITYVMGLIITKDFLKDLFSQIKYIGEIHPNNTMSMRNLIMLNYKASIECLSSMCFTGMYAIPKKGKSIFINTMLHIFNEYKGAIRIMNVDKEKMLKVDNEFSQSLPMLRMGASIDLSEEIRHGMFAQNIPIPDLGHLSLYRKQVSLWSKGLSWDVNLLHDINRNKVYDTRRN